MFLICVLLTYALFYSFLSVNFDPRRPRWHISVSLYSLQRSSVSGKSESPRRQSRADWPVLC